MDIKEITQKIDHTNLNNTAKSEDIIKLSNEAIEYKFASAVVNPTYVSLTHNLLKNTPVKTCTVIGFPLGHHTLKTKITETQQAIKDGADEIDMVININALKNKKFDKVFTEIEQIVLTSIGYTVKVIIETGLLTKEEIIIASQIAEEAGADYVKTSTGFGGVTGAQLEDIHLIKNNTNSIKIKASGGIRDSQKAIKMINEGADRIGTSSGVKIIQDLL